MSDALLQTLGGIKNVPIQMDEMFKQGMSKIKAEQQNAKIMMSTIAKDQSLTKEQKLQKIKEHQSQVQELTKQAQEMQKAYAREKKRGAI
jgi:Skp family chaperone for outer membrane proteins